MSDGRGQPGPWSPRALKRRLRELDRAAAPPGLEARLRERLLDQPGFLNKLDTPVGAGAPAPSAGASCEPARLQGRRLRGVLLGGAWSAAAAVVLTAVLTRTAAPPAAPPVAGSPPAAAARVPSVEEIERYVEWKSIEAMNLACADLLDRQRGGGAYAAEARRHAAALRCNEPNPFARRKNP